LQAIRVLIVDDHRLVGQAITEMLSRAAGIEVAGYEATAADGIARARTSRPDVVLMDFNLPDMDGVLAAGKIRSFAPNTKIVMVTGLVDDSILAEAIEVGCVGYINKGADFSSLVEAVRAAARGEMLVSPRLLNDVLKHFRSEAPAQPRIVPTQREMEILQLLARGASNETIAESLGVSVLTVRKHVQNLLGKLGAHSKLEAVSVAVRNGLVEVG